MENQTNYSPELIDLAETLLWSIAGVFTIIAILISGHLIYRHLRSWTHEVQQRCIIRIILMVPIYASLSWCSLRWTGWALYFDIARDCYEAFVIYNFFTLLMSYIEGEQPDKIHTILADKPSTKFPFPLCCFPSVKPSPLLLLVTKQSILQYVVIKPVMSIIAVILENLKVFEEGNFLPWHGYLYVTGITFMSVTTSMYFLVWFYVLMKEDLEPYEPVRKFLCIKSILFFSFWQGVAIAIIAYFEFIPDHVGYWTKDNIARGLQDSLICVEMALLSVVHIFVFSDKPYLSPTLLYSSSPVTTFAKHVINPTDMVHDIKTAYNPKNIKSATASHKAVKKVYRQNVQDKIIAEFEPLDPEEEHITNSLVSENSLQDMSNK